MRHTAALIPLLLAALAAIPSRANDTAAVLGAGGLEMTTSEDIAMASEDLYLSRSEVRVRYAFRNESDRDITTTVAFPLPDIDQNDYSEIVFLPAQDRENFVDFRVSVDGRPVQPRLEQKGCRSMRSFRDGRTRFVPCRTGSGASLSGRG
jgi:hypothetical protein